MRARLVERAEAWPWSSARAHLGSRPDGVTDIAALGAHVPDWPAFLAAGLGDDQAEAIRAGERTGRPLGDAPFLRTLEARTGRRLVRRKPGPKPKAALD